MRAPSFRTVLGLLVLAFGLSALFVPGVARILPLKSELLLFIGALAIVVGIQIAVRYWRDEKTQAEPPVPDTSVSLPVPGAEFDEQLADLDSKALHDSDYQQWIIEREDIRDRLRSLAVDTLVAQYGVSEDEAATALGEGTWTTDRHAVAFFMGEYPGTTPFDLYVQKLLPFTGTSVGTQAKHAIMELGAIARGEREQDVTAMPTETDGDEQPTPDGDGGQRQQGEVA
jgi:hypothetical protein